MSILQEYETIHKQIGKQMYSRIEKFLENHTEYYLSDVYYKQSVWDKMIEETKTINEI